jgi:serine/threonine protein kinase
MSKDERWRDAAFVIRHWSFSSSRYRNPNSRLTLLLMTISDDATQQWSELAEHMEALLQAWETRDEPPTLHEFMPKDNLALEVVAVVELIKIDLEQRHARGLWHPLEWYAEKYPQMLHAGEPPCDLIYEEYHIRKAAGGEVDPQEYFQRFPNNREALARLLNCCDIHTSTSLAAGRTKESFQPGEQLDDFDLLTRLGSGAFANVFLARQRSMQRIVALKISADKGTEGQTLAQLDHPHIVRVYDQRRLPERKLRLLYMQYAPGGSLQDVVYRVRRTVPQDRKGKLLVDAVDESLDRAGYSPPESSASRRRLAAASWPETVCRIGIQLAQALDYAHHRGILHRDVKPANVLLTADCTAKLADFNISFSSQLEGSTPAAYFGGSLAYMSPEQLEACNPEHERTPASLDGRADLFSLAAMLWELLYGKRAFREEGLPNVWAATLHEMRKRRDEPPMIPDTGSRDELTKLMTGVLTKSLLPDADARHPTGADLARELALCLQPRSKALLEMPQGGLRKTIRNWPLLSAVLVVILPNIFGAAFNLLFNSQEINDLIKEPENYAKWKYIVVCLNAFYFLIAGLLVYFIIGPAAIAVRRSLTFPVSPAEAVTFRRRSLQFGHIAAGLGVFIWCTAGIAFPAAIHVFIAPPNYPTFIGSMFICGMISAAYPFIGLTFLSTKIYFPALLPFAPGTDEDDRQLSSLSDQTLYYVAIAAGVPMIGLFLMGLLRPTNDGQDDRTWALIALVIVGFAGLWAAIWAFRSIRSAIKDLLVAVHPLDAASSMTDTADVLSKTV